MTIGEIARVYSGVTPSRAVSAFWGGTIPWVTTTEIDFDRISTTQQTITEAGLVGSSAKIAPVGTVLVAMYGQGKTRGKSAILDIPAAMNQACAAIEPDSSLDAEYLLYYLTAHYQEIRALSNSGSQENLSGELIRSIEIQLPPIDFQQKVSSIIRVATEAVASLEQLIAKKRDIKQGLMQELLTGRTRLPGFAGDWQKTLLGDHVSYLTTVALSREQMDSTSTLRCLHYGDIHTRFSTSLDAESEELPRVPLHLASNAGLLKAGDLVFADASEDAEGVGKSVEVVSVPDDGLVAGLHTIAARFDNQVLSHGFKGYLQYLEAFRIQLLRLAAGTKVLATTRSNISSIELMLPGVEEQQAIARVLQDADSEIVALQRRLESARAIKQGMMQELLTGRTRLLTEATP